MGWLLGRSPDGEALGHPALGARLKAKIVECFWPNEEENIAVLERKRKIVVDPARAR